MFLFGIAVITSGCFSACFPLKALLFSAQQVRNAGACGMRLCGLGSCFCFSLFGLFSHSSKAKHPLVPCVFKGNQNKLLHSLDCE